MDEDRAEAYRERIRRMTELFAGIAGHAEATAKDRCPYRDAADRCTALFRCRNQLADPTRAEGTLCGHKGGFDYRSAWETRPEAWEKTRAKLRAIRAEAARRRAEPEG
jgi:hypothetical protein